MPNELIKRRFLPAGATAAGKRRINHRFVPAAELLNDWNDARRDCAALWPPARAPQPPLQGAGAKRAIIVLQGGFHRGTSLIWLTGDPQSYLCFSGYKQKTS